MRTTARRRNCSRLASVEISAIDLVAPFKSNRIDSFADLQGDPVWLVSNQPNDVRSQERACALLHILRGVVVAAAVLSFSGSVVAQTDMEKQAQCELSAIRDTRSALAVQYIRSACNWLSVNGDSLLNASSKGYYICLVRQLSGAQANEAAAAIISACRTSNPL